MTISPNRGPSAPNHSSQAQASTILPSNTASGAAPALQSHDERAEPAVPSSGSSWFFVKLPVLVLLATLGSGLLWTLQEADAHASSAWTSYRDRHCATDSAPTSVDHETWQCGEVRYSIPSGATPIEFRVQAVRDLISSLPLTTSTHASSFDQ